MNVDPAQRTALASVIAADLTALDQLQRELNELQKSLAVSTPTFRDLAAAGYVLHNVYNALENTFEQISRTFENHINDRTQWHRELLSKICLKIPGIRPAVIAVDARHVLGDLLGFRHVFRHAYDYNLNADRIRLLIRDWNVARPHVVASMENFREWLLRAEG
jgi:serine phosphatase RsbU (regulator of sigma subunit)